MDLKETYQKQNKLMKKYSEKEEVLQVNETQRKEKVKWNWKEKKWREKMQNK